MYQPTATDCIWLAVLAATRVVNSKRNERWRNSGMRFDGTGGSLIGLFWSSCHSGAERSEEPGIHNPSAGTMDSGLALRAPRNDVTPNSTP